MPTSTQRMRLHRLRKSNGLRCLTLELRDIEINALVQRGAITDAQRHDPKALREAVYALLDREFASARF